MDFDGYKLGLVPSVCRRRFFVFVAHTLIFGRVLVISRHILSIFVYFPYPQLKCVIIAFYTKTKSGEVSREMRLEKLMRLLEVSSKK